jgi:hypothetical protein
MSERHPQAGDSPADTGDPAAPPSPSDEPTNVEQAPPRPAPQVRIEPGARAARLILPHDLDPASLDAAALEKLADESGVHVTEDVAGRIRAAIDQCRAQPGAVDVIIAEASDPVAGDDGRIEWVEGYGPDEQRSMPAGDDEDGRINFYDVTSYVRVEQGAHIATLHPPTEGRTGRDVTGKRLDAARGRPCPMTIDQSLKTEEGGRIIAAVTGALVVLKNSVKVTQVLEIDQYVDFSTGNIVFDGSVVVKEGVRDCFTVRATGDVTVNGLIEAATIMCGGRFSCRRGMAARERGFLIVDGDAEIGFLDDVRGRIKGDLVVRNEVMNCELAVGGRLLCERGTIVGGTCVVTGAVNVATLGSDIGTPTTLILGVGPLLSAKLTRLEARQREVAAHLCGLEERRRALVESGGRLVAVMRERLEALDQEIARDRELVEACVQKRRQIRRRLTESRHLDLMVSKFIHPGVKLKTHDFEFIFDRPVKGPVRIFWNDDRHIQCRQSDGPVRDLREMAGDQEERSAAA